ncbi:MAG: EAL domain-containing protein [Desulfobacterales bacterium]|nr:EAL domain-containing protein [Desulfobacterales bacterium]
MGKQSENTIGHKATGKENIKNANYQGLVEAANSIILSIDINGLISYINPFGMDFFGFSEDEIIGRSPMETIVPKTQSDGITSEFLLDLIKNPTPYASHTNENIKKDGTRVWVSWTNKGIFDNQGNLVEVLSVGNDISRLKRMEEELFNHRRNLESLVQERTLELGDATRNLVSSKNRLILLNTISTCIIQDKTVSFTISRILEQLTHIFKHCGAAYIRVSPGATLLSINQTNAPDALPDIAGISLDVARARPFFEDLIDNFKPYFFSDTTRTENKKGLDDFVEETGIRSGMAVPLVQNRRLMGLIFIYSLSSRTWESDEIEMMEQVGEALAVAIGHRRNKNKLVEQEEFLENVFDGVDIGIFAIAVRDNGVVLFENINQAYESLRQIELGRVIGTSLDSLAGAMSQSELDMFKDKVDQCIREKRIIKFIEETRVDGEIKYWLTRLSPVMDQGGTIFRIIGASTDISDQKLNETRLKDAQRIAKLGDFDRDIATRVFSCSDQIRKMFGWDETICPGYQDFLDIIHPEDRGYVEKEIGRAVEAKSSYDLEYRIIHDSGKEKIINEIGEVVLDDAQDPFKVTGIVQDVTEQKKFKDEIELARKVFDNAVEGVVVTDCDGIIEFVNKGFSTITGYTEEEAIGKNPNLLKSDRHDRHFYKEMWDALDRDGHWSGEIWNRRKSGEAYPEWLSITAITDHRGNPVRYMSVFNDLSDIREREEQLKFQANYDALTGLPNRTLLQDRIQMAIHRTSREEKGLAVIFLDMDDFKHVNDTLGHAKGDLLLQQFASRLLGSVREQDTVARYGGDEFVILIPDTNDTDTIITIIERIRLSLLESFIIDAKEFFLGVSIGVTICPDDGSTPDVLIANADMAMYRSKEHGKGKYAFFTSELNRQVALRVELETDLRHALSRNEFSIYLQPKLDIATGQICGAEALLRWQHPEKGMVRPDAFIPLAEETGLINPIGEWVLDQACLRAKECSKIVNRYFSVAVNISSRQVKDIDLVDLVSRGLASHQIPPECLDIEITESAVMGNVDKAKTMLRQLNDMGIKISIDDFGTGFSSLSYLRLFPVSILKIDKSFVDDIPMDNDSNTMVTTIISMARHLNLTTVAEGVEKAEQLDFLKTNNCDQIQGYYFAPPMPVDEFMVFLKKNT